MEDQHGSIVTIMHDPSTITQLRDERLTGLDLGSSGNASKLGEKVLPSFGGWTVGLKSKTGLYPNFLVRDRRLCHREVTTCE